MTPMLMWELACWTYRCESRGSQWFPAWMRHDRRRLSPCQHLWPGMVPRTVFFTAYVVSDCTSACLSQRTRVSDCQVLCEVDLTLNAKHDHYAVAATFCFYHPLGYSPGPSVRKFMLKASNLACQLRRNRFQQAMWQFSSNPPWHIDFRGSDLWLAPLHLRKPWISCGIWSIVRQSFR